MGIDIGAIGTPAMRGRLEKHLAKRVRFGDEVLTLRDLYARGTECSELADGKGGTYFLAIPTEGHPESGVVVPRMVWQAWRSAHGHENRCPKCMCVNGAHGMIHTRYGNGGGGNSRCPLG